MNTATINHTPFDSLIGQNTAKIYLEQCLTRHQIAPAYLFAGKDGIGKVTCANIFAQILLNTEQLDLHPDFLRIEATYRRNDDLIPVSVAKREQLDLKAQPQIRIEQIRDLIRFVSQSPTQSPRLVVILESVESMQSAAANALLKTLEEPGNCVLILVTNAKELLLPTIQSRCLYVPFSPLSSFQLEIVLASGDYPQIAEDATIITLAQGSPGRAIALYHHLQTIRGVIELDNPDLSRPLALSKQIISNLSLELQFTLLNYWMQSFWTQNLSVTIADLFRKARYQLDKHGSEQLVWDNLLLSLKRVI